MVNSLRLKPRPPQRFKRYFFTGLVVLVPVVLTFLMVRGLFLLLDGWLAPAVQKIFGRPVPGLGIIATFVLIWAVGVVASHVIGRKLVGFFDALLLHVPILNNIYKTIKQVVDTLSSERYRNLKGVVMVQYPCPGIYSLGFVTQEMELSLERHSPVQAVSVFVPFNHLYLGSIIIVKKSDVIATGLTVQEGIQCILTAGGSFPKKLTGSRL